MTLPLEYFPNEMKEEILFSLPPSDLLSFCSTSRQFYTLCNSRTFWREKFQREKLPLLEEGTSLKSWLRIYEHSLHAEREAKRLFSRFITVRGTGFLYSFRTSKLSSLEPFRWLGINVPSVVSIYKTREGFRIEYKEGTVNLTPQELEDFLYLYFYYKESS